MKLVISSDSISKNSTETVLLPIFEGFELPECMRRTASLEKLLERVGQSGFKACCGKTLRVLENTRQTLLIGLGKAEDYDEDAFIKASCAAFKAAGDAELALNVEDWAVENRSAEWTILHLAIAALTVKEPTKEPIESKDNACCAMHTRLAAQDAMSALELGQAIGNAINRAKYLGNLAPNICTPQYLAKEAQKLRKLKNVTVKIHDEKALQKLGAGGILAVSRGAANPARLIELHYKGADKSVSPICLVGKGITFDAGGLCLKPGRRMNEMKYDMAGAAAVLSVFETAAAMRLPLNLTVIVAASENMPDGNAYRPADVITMLSGDTVEITNTDAEGRLLLADALTYAARFEPACVIDVATLTGAVQVALGDYHHGLFANDPILRQTLEEAADVSQDALWALPFDTPYYRSMLKSNVADTQNTGPAGLGGASVAATFLARFADRDTPWAHLDVAATAWKSGQQPLSTGRPVALLLAWLHQQSVEQTL